MCHEGKSPAHISQQMDVLIEDNPVPIQRLTQFKATQLGLHTACLPVKEYMKMSSSSAHHINLPINLGEVN